MISWVNSPYVLALIELVLAIFKLHLANFKLQLQGWVLAVAEEKWKFVGAYGRTWVYCETARLV